MAATPTLLASASFTTFASPKRTNNIGDAYVLEIARTASHYVASASAPKNTIHLFDRSNFAPVYALAGHEGGTSALAVAPAASSSVAGGHALFSCGKDARVKVWDERTGTVALEMRTSGRPRALLSLDVASDGHMLATGTELAGDDACIHFFDLRSPAAPLRTHSQTHSEDITVVKFAPAGERLLLSASSDGLVCTSNPDEQDEDEAGVHVGNWGCSIASAGWIEAKGVARAWAASDMETFSLWSEELDLVQSLDVRQLSMDGQPQWTTDYVIGAHTSSSQLRGLDNGMRLFLGSNEGALTLVSPASSAYLDGSTPGVAAWMADATFNGPHAGIVRSAFWDEDAGILLSGGEDGTLSAWNCPPLGACNAEMADEGGLGGRGVVREQSEEMDVDSPRAKRGRHDDAQTGKKLRKL